MQNHAKMKQLNNEIRGGLRKILNFFIFFLFEYLLLLLRLFLLRLLLLQWMNESFGLSV